MNRNTKIALSIIGGLLVVCICVVAAGAIALRYAGRALESAVATDPTQVAEIAATVAEYDTPSGYEQAGMQFLGFQIVYLNPLTGNSGPMIMMMQMPPNAELSQSQMEEQLRQAMDRQNPGQNIQFNTVDEVSTTIRGQQTILTIREGESDGRTFRQASGMFTGNGGPTILMISGPADSWDQDMIDAFIASIR